ncbi:BPTI/Kunitz-type proteinase inhibitor domain-containing protein [Leptospira sp. GIMC2001]|uniref:BPTI/Kunitz-type proteinase inhibitor domain-containing protein n=1 Tax=Leptospira sp. GIMC2001 TaxID=1513297 RepID=UPI00234B6DEA|nr:BPTI/Kunitz-type proteinase inhibitor domain-containing protein [Leptospira sp. GIMC2001]WCL49081.1 BPTI/Kunitz-type proteinase inhibitor domain-containing protein [Leptospira sp. GIMC2001]
MKHFLLLLLIIFTVMLCNGNSKGNTASTSIDMKERCSLAPDGGPCRALIPGYYYDAANNSCLEFNYGGCKGSLPFKMKSDCEQNCIR